MLADGNHNISIIVKGASSSQLSGGTAVEFGGFMCVRELKEMISLTEIIADIAGQTHTEPLPNPRTTSLPSLGVLLEA
jgi:hypothetical protein